MSNNNNINNKKNIMSSNIGTPTLKTRTESPISSYLNDKYNTIIGTLIGTASTSEINQQLGACVAKGKHPLSRSCPNREGTFCGNQMCGSLHAEANALVDYYGTDLFFDKKKGWSLSSKTSKSKKIDLIVIRINRQGDLVNSRPCYNCVSMMKAVNIKKVYYSADNGNIVGEYVKDMISIHASSASKLIHCLKISSKMTFEAYFEELLRKLFPATIKQINLDNFLKYNLGNVLPHHTSVIETTNGIKIVSILNKTGKIVSSKLIP